MGTLFRRPDEDGVSGVAFHPERLAWDGARTIVRAVGSDQVYRWLSDQFGVVLGPAYAHALSDSYARLWSDGRPEAPHREAGLWRARIHDLLLDDPALAVPVQRLIDETSERLSRATDLRGYGPPEPSTEPRVIELGLFQTSGR
jgi:hypothetical protein